ncbi:MAG: aminodeoxychorismate/anthranilate synthase component II [Xanthomonadales bacterium]|nr:aminodeoxychorismate/anthranilate synthase component II [Xanthomonadales bacterium]
MILMIDNYDSFTFNLVQYLGELGAEVKVCRNDELEVSQVGELKPSHIVISPGPCTPDEAGISLQLVREYAGKIPIFGVCLGHQAIAQAFGATIIRADRIMHGKTSKIHHDGQGVFADIPDPFTATRYHSLVIQPDTLADELEVTSWTLNPDGSHEEIMGVRHKQYPLEGVQFHPESILTEHGHDLLKNFLEFN